jgi:histone H3/H4
MNETVRTAIANYYLMYMPRSPDTDRVIHNESALENIRMEQRQTDLTFSRPYFHKLVMEITRQYSNRLVWTSNALEALQMVAEDYTIEKMELAQLVAIHRRSRERSDLDSHLQRVRTRHQRAERYTRRAAEVAQQQSVASPSTAMDAPEDQPAAAPSQPAANAASLQVLHTGVATMDISGAAAAQEQHASSSSSSPVNDQIDPLSTDGQLASLLSTWEPELAAVVQDTDLKIALRMDCSALVRLC